ncbi:putative replication initiation protein [Paramuricea placomus associated circular virus]|uniref:putative replication initiation protein n=1 Tax=Paramuricea placomus associated circular virus TaxID=1692260 RepID=UPI0006A72FCA|nr:putative replication initiation protein [Paramuricea placomus associated circular virus]AKV62296.1 putative replication initiation protein [Paramuricea placomus associated circular virus]
MFGEADEGERANLDIEPPKKRKKRDHRAEGKRRALRYRNWVFTLNNPQEHGFPRLTSDMIWLRYGEEVAPTTGTPHLQGVVHFKSKRVMPTDLYPWCRNAHWEHMGGTISANLAYTGKEANEEAGTLHEFGVRPLSNKEAREKGAAATKERYINILAHAKAGEFDKLEEEYPGDFLRMYKTLHCIRDGAQGRSEPIARLEHWWIVGPTGCGKSRAVWETVGASQLYSKLLRTSGGTTTTTKTGSYSTTILPYGKTKPVSKIGRTTIPSLRRSRALQKESAQLISSSLATTASQTDSSSPMMSSQ